ncbi:MAG: DNA topoisomerase [Ruminococcaceae bacterium]|nr:DNA topoisomerase [Oscillospiraceae bacterium]
MKKTYDDNSISSLKGADRVRLRPGVIFGSDGIDGCEHSFFEILSNSIDEAREGYGTEIEITRFADKSIEVKDNGRGIPMDYNENEKRYNWELIFCELYAGGKYKNNSGENYEYSLGLNGLGTCATQYSSSYMDVQVQYGGKKYTMHFEKGNPVGDLQVEETRSKKTGSTIKWRPDTEVFTDINIPLEYFQDVLRRQSVVNSGLKFILYNQTPDGWDMYEYLYENGITDYIREISDGKEFTPVFSFDAQRRGRDRDDKPDYNVKMQFAFCFNNEINMVEYYHNSSFLEHGGAPDRAVKSAFVAVMDKYLKNQNKYNKNESKIGFSDIADSLILVSNSFSTVTSYENQTKKSITNKFIQEAMTDVLREQIEVCLIENKEAAEKIAQQILINKRSRESAEKARVAAKKNLTGSLDMTNRINKFINCRTKDVERREIYIVEGDSALGSCKKGRDAEFQAIIPVRGKILNCLKADYGKIFKNDIITDLVKVLGCGIEIKSKHSKDLSTFDLDNLRWSKVIICTDADVDGYQIRTLILTMIYVLMPTLIKEGKVYIAESPLFEITCGKDTYFAFNEAEKQEITEKLTGKKFKIQRSKGLGENEPEMMWQTTMNPETRRLVRVTYDDAEKTMEMFDVLLGDNLAARKDFIAEFGQNFLDLADIS